MAGCQGDICQAIFSLLHNEKMALEEDNTVLQDYLHELSLSRKHFMLSFIRHDEEKVIICFNCTYSYFGLGNGLLSDHTKPLPEPMLTYHERSWYYGFQR